MAREGFATLLVGRSENGDGVDPHKRLNAVVVLNMRGVVLARRSLAQPPLAPPGGRQWS